MLIDGERNFAAPITTTPTKRREGKMAGIAIDDLTVSETIVHVQINIGITKTQPTDRFIYTSIIQEHRGDLPLNQVIFTT